jgi:hypothetical protein
LARLGNAGTLQSAERKLLNRQTNIDAGAMLAGSAYQTGKTNLAAGNTFFGGAKTVNGVTTEAVNRTDGFFDRLEGGLFG